MLLGEISFGIDKSCSAFIKAIAETERLKIEEKVKACKFIAVMSDGSTDVDGLVDVRRADSRGILDAIKRALIFPNTLQNDVLNKLIGFTCDGASVNTGEKNGVIALMHRDISDRIVLVHCLVHRLELAYKKAVKKHITLRQGYHSPSRAVCFLYLWWCYFGVTLVVLWWCFGGAFGGGREVYIPGLVPNFVNCRPAKMARFRVTNCWMTTDRRKQNTARLLTPCFSAYLTATRMSTLECFKPVVWLILFMANRV